MNMYEFSQPTSILEFHNSRYFSKQRIVTPDSHIFARFISGSTLPYEYRSTIHVLTRKTFYSKSLGLAISSIPGASHSFFVCHTCLLACHADFFYADGRMLLAVSACAAILLFLFILENNDFIVFSHTFQNTPH